MGEKKHDFVRFCGVTLNELVETNLPYDALRSVHGYVYGSTPTEYHFAFGPHSDKTKFKIFPDDGCMYNSQEFTDLVSRLEQTLGIKIEDDFGEFNRKLTRQEISDYAKTIFEDNRNPRHPKKEWVTLDYRKLTESQIRSAGVIKDKWDGLN